MKTSLSQVFAVLGVAMGVALQSCSANYRLIDLTHTQDPEAGSWPGIQPFERKVVSREFTKDVPGQWVEHYEFKQNEHIGTHMDAPVHFSKGNIPIDQIPLKDLTAKAVVIDIRRQTNMGSNNYKLTVQDILDFEKEHGEIEEGSIVLIHTGNSKFWNNQTRYMGYPSKEAARKKDTKKLNFPGISEEACTFFRDDRKIAGVGLDSLSPDAGDAFREKLDAVAHRILLGARIWILENVGTNIDRLPPSGFYVMALPYKMKDGSGAPTRVVALLPGGEELDFAAISGSPSNVVPWMAMMVASKVVLSLVR